MHFYNYYDNISLGETTKKQNKYLGNINKIIFLLKVKFFLTPNISYDIILHGHTHVTGIKEKDNKCTLRVDDNLIFTIEAPIQEIEKVFDI